MSEGSSPVWDGVGLPPVAAARVARFAASGVRTSLLSTPAAAGLAAVGLEPVGEVMGCIVQQVGYSGYRGCGIYNYGGPYATDRQMISSTSKNPRERYAGYRPYVDAIYHGYRTALSRMRLEAERLGADGVVGVRLTATRLAAGRSTREFLALGTAVRARTEQHLEQPFHTDLSGPEVAKLMGAGWVPVTLGIGVAVVVRHDDWRTQQQRSRMAGNLEVSGYTQLVNRARSDARAQFAHAIAAAGADGAVVSDLRMRTWAVEPNEGHRDHVAEAFIWGTTIAAIDRSRRPRTRPVRPLTFMPLTGARAAGVGRAPAGHRRTTGPAPTIGEDT